MSRTIAAKAAQETSEILDDGARRLKRAARRFAAEVGDTLSTEAVGLGHTVEDIAEEARSRSGRTVARLGRELRARPTLVAAIGAGLVAFVGLVVAGRRQRRAGR